ncbi:MAG: RIP metalloprotease RseP [Betaproteobacteria bacterium]|nr:RIP metalloprotease RseP [Betaproteobacteria bacterium]
MSGAFTTVLAFIVTVGLLVVVHEYGHYFVARLAGVKVLRFSVGFGRVLWSRRTGPDRTEWALCAVPLGGYVKMLDTREGDVLESEMGRAFDRQAVGKRIAIVLAGPAANFLAAFVLYWALFVTGLPGMKPVLAEPPAGSAAQAAGLSDGDVVLSVGGNAAGSWTDVRWLLLKQSVRGGSVALELEGATGGRATRSLDLSGLTPEDLDKDFLAKLGMKPYVPRVSPTLGRVQPGGAGERAGLLAGDRVIAVDGMPVASWSEFTARVRASPEKPIALDVERAGQRLALNAVPEGAGKTTPRTGLLRVEPGAEMKEAFERMQTTVRLGPLEAVPRAVHRVWDLSVFSLEMLVKMVTGQVSWKNLSGPITIADYAGQTASMGWVSFAGFLALVSVSLGILNLLPVPLLDGGHLVYYSVEIVTGSPVSDRTLEIGQRVGLAILAGLTFFALYNDINRLITG